MNAMNGTLPSALPLALSGLALIVALVVLGWPWWLAILGFFVLLILSTIVTTTLHLWWRRRLALRAIERIFPSHAINLRQDFRFTGRPEE